MADIRLYIDGELADVGKGTDITLNIKSNLFRDITKMMSNTTGTIKLPKTVKNQRIFQHVDMVQGDGFATELHNVQLYRNGLQLIANGQAVCLSVSEDIEITLVWGIFSALGRLQSSGKTLSQLQSGARLKWPMEGFTPYDKALLQGFFYADYNPFHMQEASTEWTGVDTPEGAFQSKQLTLAVGGVRTGKVGTVISGVTDTEQKDLSCTVSTFKVGQTLRMNGVVGGGDNYRLYAILDTSNKVIAIGDASNEATVAAEYTVKAPTNARRIVVNVNTAKSAGSYIAIEQGVDGSTSTADTATPMVSKSFGGGHGSSSIGAPSQYVQPVVSVRWLLALIWEQTGINFAFDGEAGELIDTLAIPLISNKANELSVDGMLDAELVARSGNGALQIKTLSKSTLFSNAEGSTSGELVAVANGAVTLDVQGLWSWDASHSRPTGSTTTEVDGQEVVVYQYQYTRNYIEMRVTPATGREEDVTTYIIGDERSATDGTQSDTSDNLVNGRFHYLLSGFGQVDIEAGDRITFTMKNRKGQLRDVQFSGGTVRGTLIAGDKVSRGGYYPIADNLPDIKIIDLIKFLACITGTFPLQHHEPNRITFVAYDKVWDNIGSAQDWTERIMLRTEEAKPRNISFTVGDFAQRNLYRWKEDEYTYGSYDGVLTVENKSLDEERTVITFPFAASDGNRVPIYTPVKKGGTFTAPTVEGGDYQACKERIMRMSKSTGGYVALSFDIDMQQIITTRYARLAESLQEAKVIKERVRLTDTELLSFDERTPVYLSQYAAYFAVTEIRQTGEGVCEVTMFRIRQVRKVRQEPRAIQITVRATNTDVGYTFRWWSDYPLGSTLRLTIKDSTGDADLTHILLNEGSTEGIISDTMYWDDPHGAEVEVWDEADKNTYTVTLEITKNITIDIFMFADDDNFVHFRVSEALDKPVIIDVQVGVGNDIRRTSIIIPTGKTSGKVPAVDGKPFTRLVWVSTIPTLQPDDFNKYTINALTF